MNGNKNDRVTGSVSGMTRYLIAGEDAGESKLAKAKEKKVEVIDEAKLLKLIETLPEQKPKNKKLPKGPSRGPKKKDSLSNVMAQRGKNRTQQNQENGISVNNNKGFNGTELLFVEKYKPQTSYDLIGNNSCIKQLKQHLMRWEVIKNASGKGKNAPKKGVLLSGQPGIGKTSAVNVIAKELGYTTVEFNASDTRSKKSLRNVIEQSLNNRTMTDFFSKKIDKNKNNKNKKAQLLQAKDKKNLIIMDEVDGMSSGDRGGMQELVGYIQKSKIPIICICNDRQSPKVRTLSNYCLDLRFRKPTVQQVSNRLYNIAIREGFKTDIPTINKLAEGTNGDIRQMLHMLQFWSNENLSKNLTYNDVKQRMEKSSKDLTMGPWDVAPKLFYSNTSIIKGIEYYFVDYSLMPLMIQENYLSINKGGYNNSKWSVNDLREISLASESIAHGDLIDTNIRQSQQYAALPYHGVLSSLKPAQHASRVGRVSGRIAFPSWLGKFSNRRKNDRLFSELAANINASHHVPNCGMTGNQISLDYLGILKDEIVKPLQKGNDAIDQVIEFMKLYNISREDWDTVHLLGDYQGSKGKGMAIPTKTKSAFTRKCKIELTTANTQPKKKKKGAVTDLKVKNEDEVASEDEGDDNDQEEEDDDISKDSNIKMKKAKGRKAATKKKRGGTKKKATTKKATTKNKTTTKRKRKKKTFDD